MVVNAATLNQPLHTQTTPYLLLGSLVVSIYLGVAVPCFFVVFVIFIYMYGFRDNHLWPSQKQGLSAYSIFNPGQQEIPGTLNAAGIDREIRGNGGIEERKTYTKHSWGKGQKLK